MKDYFISFDFWGSTDGSPSKFLSGIVKVDLSNEPLNGVALNLIKKHCPEVNVNAVNVKINAFNLV